MITLSPFVDPMARIPRSGLADDPSDDVALIGLFLEQFGASLSFFERILESIESLKHEGVSEFDFFSGNGSGVRLEDGMAVIEAHYSDAMVKVPLDEFTSIIRQWIEFINATYY